MKTYRPWALAVALALPVLAPAAETKAPPCAAPASAPSYDIEMADLIDKVAKRSGKQFIVDPRVRAQVSGTGIDLEKIDYPRLLAILAVHQFAAYEVNGVVRVMPDANARQFPIPVTTGVPANALDDEYVTVLLSPKNMCVAHAVPVLRPLMPQAAHMAAFFQSNTLIISDHASNARRIADIVERLDSASPKDQKCPPEGPSPVPDASKRKK